MFLVYMLVAILGAAAMIFAIQNPDPVAVSFLDWRIVNLPLSLLLMLSVFVGIVFAWVSGFAREIELKLKIRRLEKRVVDLSTPADQPPGVDGRRAHDPLPKGGAVVS